MFKYFPGFFKYFQDLLSNIKAFGENNVFFELLQQKPCRIIYKFRQNTISGPDTWKLDQNSDFGHVRTYSWLHKLRNTQGKIHGTYLGNIYGIYKECITNISINIYDIKRSDTQAPPSAAAPLGLCVWWIYWWIFMVIS